MTKETVRGVVAEDSTFYSTDARTLLFTQSERGRESSKHDRAMRMSANTTMRKGMVRQSHMLRTMQACTSTIMLGLAIAATGTWSNGYVSAASASVVASEPWNSLQQQHHQQQHAQQQQLRQLAQQDVNGTIMASAAPTQTGTQSKSSYPTSLPTQLSDAPSGQPTLGPSLPTSSCTTDTAECCEDSDCSTSTFDGVDSNGHICLTEQCVPATDRCLQFMLEWQDDDELYDLFVRTPSGSELWRANPTNFVPGFVYGVAIGTWEQASANMQRVTFIAPQASSIPQACEVGMYEYFVMGSTVATSSLQSEWNLRVLENNSVVFNHTGNGPSNIFVYSVAPDESSAPSITPTVTDEHADMGSDSMCAIDSTNSAQCCTDVDCAEGQACANRNCVQMGFPRFTLAWVGDDDKDLIVKTPLGTFVSFQQPFDASTNGRLEGDTAPTAFGHHVENIYFSINSNPTDSSTSISPVAISDTATSVVEYPPDGAYECTILTKQDDKAWTLIVAYNETIKQTIEGVGDDVVTYNLLSDNGTPLPTVEESPSAAPTEMVTMPPTQACDMNGNADTQCCVTSDCTADGTVCANRNCVKTGAFRFTLSWFGDDDKDLRVSTPTGELIFFDNPLDEVTQGQLEQDVAPTTFDHHVENIYFPTKRSILLGDYGYGVSSKSGDGPWQIDVFVDGVLQATQRGRGNSLDFRFMFVGNRDSVGVSSVYEPDSTATGEDRNSQPSSASSLSSSSFTSSLRMFASTPMQCLTRSAFGLFTTILVLVQ